MLILVLVLVTQSLKSPSQTRFSEQLVSWNLISSVDYSTGGVRRTCVKAMTAILCNHYRPFMCSRLYNDTHAGPDARSRLHRWEDGAAVSEITLQTRCYK